MTWLVKCLSYEDENKDLRSDPQNHNKKSGGAISVLKRQRQVEPWGSPARQSRQIDKFKLYARDKVSQTTTWTGPDSSASKG